MPYSVSHSVVASLLTIQCQVSHTHITHTHCSAIIFVGVVIAVLGSELENGQFEVDEVCFAGVPNVPTTSSLLTTDKYVRRLIVIYAQLYFCRYVILVSGLNIGSAWCDHSSIQMFIDFVCGQTGVSGWGTLLINEWARHLVLSGQSHFILYRDTSCVR